jgi:uncharacterized protein (TIGR03435 family)
MTWESHVFDLLTASLTRPLVLAAAAWLALHLLRIRHPASRHAVWTAVLIGMLLVAPLSVLAPHWDLPLPPRAYDSTGRSIATTPSASSEIEPLDSVTQQDKLTSDPRVREGFAFAWPPIKTFAVWCYFAGVLAMAIYRLMGWILLRRVTAGARPALGRRVFESGHLAAPVAAGVLRPVVILPSEWRAWRAATKRAVLGHEFAHLRRNDTLISALTRLAQCVLWFHPLAWWLSRKIHDLAELACDAAVLEKLGDPAGYSRILLGFAEAVNQSSYRAALPGLAMASNSDLGQRIDGVFEISGGTMRKLSRPTLLLMLAGTPVLCLAATIGWSGSSPRAERPITTPAIGAIHYHPPIDTRTPPDLSALTVKPRVTPRTVAQQNALPIAPTQTLPRPAAPAAPKFEVAAIKLCKGDDAGGRGGRGGGGAASPGTLTVRCQTMESLIRAAYLQFPNGEPRARDPRNGRWIETISHRMLIQPIKGGPGWLESDRYTIEAKAEGEPNAEMMRGPMMQRLLEERFSLKIHRETKDVDVFNLVVAKGGPKLDAAKEACVDQQEFFANGPPPPPPPNSGQTSPTICGAFRHFGPQGEDISRRETMMGLATELSRMLDRDVIDKTGIVGVFDIRMKLTAADLFHGLSFGPNGPPVDTTPDASEPAGVSVFAAVQKLGLKLEAAKASGDFLVIDRVEKPSEN